MRATDGGLIYPHANGYALVVERDSERRSATMANTDAIPHEDLQYLVRAVTDAVCRVKSGTAFTVGPMASDLVQK